MLFAQRHATAYPVEERKNMNNVGFTVVGTVSGVLFCFGYVHFSRGRRGTYPVCGSSHT